MSNPSAVTLLEAVKEFLINDISPQVNKHSGFHLRVVCNILSIVSREIEQGAALNETAMAELQRLLESPNASTLDTLNEQLCDAIKQGAIDPEDPELLSYLKVVTKQQVAIDNPKYSGYQQALAKENN